MLNLIIKVALVIGGLGFTAYLFADNYIGWGIFMVFVLALVILSIFRNERILLAMVSLQRQNMDKAGNHLSKIKQPQYLVKRQRAYYYYLMSLISAQSNGLGESEQLMRKALEIGLKSKQDQALAKLQLASAALGKGNRIEAKNLLAEAKKLDEKGALKAQIKELSGYMQQAPSKNQIRMAQMHRGGKGFRQKKQR